MNIRWRTEPDERDYPAAEDYMSLLLPPARAQRLAQRFRAAETTYCDARDLLRAAELPLLSKHNKHVGTDLDRIRDDEPLSPILILRGSMGRRLPVQIVDGYYRLCAVYRSDEDAIVPCRMIDLDW